MKKRFWAILITLLCGCFVILQADDVKVTMKNGTVFTGELREFVPTDHVTVVVAGIETTIPISEVASVERPNAYQGPTTQKRDNGDNDTKLQYGKYNITDTKQYPDSFVLHIGDQDLTMVLVRGGWFNMGFDGRHSLSWDSEPVHKVTLSSYYVSKQFLNCHTAETLLGKKKISNSIKPYNCRIRKDAEELINKISKSSGAPYRLLTEAEWEYAALMPFASALFANNKIEWCSDYWGKYPAADQINPKGPSSGKYYVIRSYSSDNEKWKRLKDSGNRKWQNSNAVFRYAIGDDTIIRIRVAISADQIN